MCARWLLKYCGKNQEQYKNELPKRLFGEGIHRDKRVLYISDPTITAISKIITGDQICFNTPSALFEFFSRKSQRSCERGAFLKKYEQFFADVLGNEKYSNDILEKLKFVLDTGDRVIEIMNLRKLIPILKRCDLESIAVLFKKDGSINWSYCEQLDNYLKANRVDVCSWTAFLWEKIFGNNPSYRTNPIFDVFRSQLDDKNLKMDKEIIDSLKAGDLSTFRSLLQQGYPDSSNGSVLNSVYSAIFGLAHFYPEVVKKDDNAWYITFNGNLTEDEKECLKVKLSETTDIAKIIFLKAALDKRPISCRSGIPYLIKILYNSEVLNDFDSFPDQLKNKLCLSLYLKGTWASLLYISKLLPLAKEFNDTTKPMLNDIEEPTAIDQKTFRNATTQISNVRYSPSKQVNEPLIMLLGYNFWNLNPAIKLLKENTKHDTNRWQEFCNNLSHGEWHNAALQISHRPLDISEEVQKRLPVEKQIEGIPFEQIPLTSLMASIIAIAFLYSLGTNKKTFIPRV